MMYSKIGTFSGKDPINGYKLSINGLKCERLQTQLDASASGVKNPGITGLFYAYRTACFSHNKTLYTLATAITPLARC